MREHAATQYTKKRYFFLPLTHSLVCSLNQPPTNQACSQGQSDLDTGINLSRLSIPFCLLIMLGATKEKPKSYSSLEKAQAQEAAVEEKPSLATTQGPLRVRGL